MITINNGIGSSFQDGVNKLVPESASDAWCSPKDLHGNLLPKDSGRARPNSTSSGDNHETAEQRNNVHHTESRNTTNPELRESELERYCRVAA